VAKLRLIGVDEFVTLLETHFRPADTVQPQDWVADAVHAMLIARVKITTLYVYDEYFYHGIHVLNIPQLPARFMDDLRRIKPRFIIKAYYDGPFSEPTGPNTARDLP
jgi:hypothetical protein